MISTHTHKHTIKLQQASYRKEQPLTWSNARKHETLKKKNIKKRGRKPRISTLACFIHYIFVRHGGVRTKHAKMPSGVSNGTTSYDSIFKRLMKTVQDVFYLSRGIISMNRF